jgi:hypothetical protein
VKQINRSIRSQASIFIIIGVIILFSLAMYIYTTYYTKNTKNDVFFLASQDIKDDPVYSFVSECLTKTSRDAIKHIGERGGYYSLKDNNIDIADSPTNTEAVLLSGPLSADTSANPYAIPYYWHMLSPDGCSSDCVFGSRMPYLNREHGAPSIEEEMDRYIEENIERCFNDFADLKRQAFAITPIGKPQVESSANQKDTSFILNYIIEVKHDKSVYNLEKFYIVHDVSLFEIYSLALEVSMLQDEYRYLENMALNLISNYGEVEGIIPPIVDSTFVFGSTGTKWRKSHVKETVRDILSKYVRGIRVIGTKNYKNLGRDPLSEKVIDYQMRIPASRDYDLDITFNYLNWWPIYFDLNCNGEVCGPESFSTTTTSFWGFPFGNQRYRSYYSFAYPVLVKIYDHKAFDGEGYPYYFFLESNVKHNEALKEEGDYFEGQISTGMIFMEQHRNSGNCTLNITDNWGMPLNDVSLFYICGKESAIIGEVKDGFFNDKLPICAGGKLMAAKEGYLQQIVYASTDLDVEMDLGTVQLYGLKDVNVTINKQKFTKPADGNGLWVPDGKAALKKNQEATVIIQKIKEEYGQPDYIQATTLSQNTPQSTIKLASGEYNIKVIMIDKNNIEIPTREKDIGTLLSPNKITIPGIRFNQTAPSILGGLEGNFTVTDKIYDSDTLVINTVAFELGEIPKEDRYKEDIAVFGQVLNYSIKYRNILELEYK